MERVYVNNRSINYRNYARKINRRDKTRKNIIKLAVVLLVFVAAVVLILIFSSNAVKTKAAEGCGKTKYYKSVLIADGDSLWSIADEYCDDDAYDDTRDYIKEVKQINNLQTDNLTYGQYIIVPYYE